MPGTEELSEGCTAHAHNTWMGMEMGMGMFCIMALLDVDGPVILVD
jgi:hypothetical protein